jgi:hypothetical protein
VPTTIPASCKISTAPPQSETDIVTALFLAQLPRFLVHTRFAFRRVACPQTRDDRVAEAISLAWKHFVVLSARGRKPERFVTTLALRCTQAVKAGRKLVGNEGGRDAVSPVAHVRHGFAVGRLPSEHEVTMNRSSLPVDLSEALADNTRIAVLKQAAYRLDFPWWRALPRARDRKILDALGAAKGPGRRPGGSGSARHGSAS